MSIRPGHVVGRELGRKVWSLRRRGRGLGAHGKGGKKVAGKYERKKLCRRTYLEKPFLLIPGVGKTVCVFQKQKGR